MSCLNSIVLARGRGIARAIAYLYEGCCEGDPTAIGISAVLGCVIVGIVVLKIRGHE